MNIETMQIPVILTAPQINQLLAILSEKPLKEVVDLFNTIKAQGDRVIAAAMQQGQQASQQPAPPPPPPKQDDPPVDGIDTVLNANDDVGAGLAPARGNRKNGRAHGRA